jgi:two-component system sensor histidine kinase/response regulator
MGGTIEVESEAGQGSLFRVKLPAEIAEAADVKTPADDKPRVIGLAPTEKTRRILVADDNRENLLLLKSLLESVGFFVLEAENGQEALAAFKKESPDFIWMDMRMPVMDGYEATRRIRKWESGSRKSECGSGKEEVGRRTWEGRKEKAEGGEKKSEVGPGVVQKARDYAEAGMGNSEVGMLPAESENRNKNRKDSDSNSAFKGVPIFAITASAFDEQRQDILAAGCDDMVIKPFQAHEIFEPMGRLLDIEYIYEPKSEAAPARVPEVELTAAMLADLPDDLLRELRQATLALNRENALAVIARIADHAPEVAAGLKELVDNFQMAELQGLLEVVE